MFGFYLLFSLTQDLCDRHDKGVLHDHQKAMQKMGQYKKKKMSAAVQNSDVSQNWKYKYNHAELYFGCSSQKINAQDSPVKSVLIIL